MKHRIFFNEVVTRDGFQIEPAFIPTDDKVALIDALSDCGYAKIEVTSFTSPKAIPMLRDAEAVMGRIQRRPGVEYTVLVPNLRGAERALESKADELNLVMSTSETHNLANLRMTREMSFAALAGVIQHVQGTAGGSTPVNVSLSTCFGCPMEGDVPMEGVLRLAERFADLGVRGLTICDTTGMAHPAQVGRMVEALQKAFSHLQLTLHFHNTRGMGLANLLAAVQGGITRFDGSLGGLGGCPYAPGASGNISSEDAIHMLDAMGYDTGIDLARLLPIARQLPELVGHAVPGQVAKAGRITDLHPPPDAVIAAREPASVGATRFDAGPLQVETAPLGGSAAHAVASVGARFDAGPLQVETAPLGGSAAHAVASVGARFNAGPLQVETAPSEGSAAHAVASVGASAAAPGRPKQGSTPLGGSAAHEAVSAGATRFDAGPPQVETAPSGGSAAHEVASVGATSS